MRKERLIKRTLLGLGIVGVMFANRTMGYTSLEVLDNGDLKVCGTEYISDSNGAQGCITIQGKNVGATTTGAGPDVSDTSCGNYYQRGNNYGFSSDPNASVTTGNQQIDCSTYNPFNPFSSSTFIIGFNDYCISRNDNLWGGGSDNGLVYPVENGVERQGPCPEGYHVPSKGEWYALMDMWAGEEVNGRIDSNISTFYTDFQIPFAGYRAIYSDGFVDSQGYYAGLRSSSPYVGNGYAWHFSVSERESYADSNYFSTRTDGLPVRCFKDAPILFQVTIYDGTGDGKVELWSGDVESGQTVELPDLNLSKPNSYFVFDKCYMDPELTEEFVLDTPITGDLELYAGYKESDKWIDRNGNPFEWDDITICDPEDSSACITMMDRNLGATTAGTGVTCVKESITCVKVGWLNLGYKDYNTCVNDYRTYGEYYSAYYSDPEEMCGGGYYEGFDSYEECEAEKTRLENEYNECKENNKGVYGYHYQWGNNIGFDLINNEFTTTYDWAKWNLSYENYGYNRNSLFIRGDRDEGECYNGCDYWENNQHYNGLRGGSGDSEENNRGYDIDNHIAINLEGRQGPCPEGYHVPSAGEWNTVLDYYISENGDKGLIYNDGSYDGGLIDSYCGSGIVSYCYKEMLLSFCVEEDEDGNCIDYIEDFGEEKVDCETEEYDRKEVICNGYGDFFNLLNSYFKIPYAGDFYQYYGSGFEYLGSKNVLWSSSPVLTYSSSKDGIGESGIHSSNRINGNSVRCFKNTPDTEIQEEGGNDNTGGNNGGGNSGHSGGGHSGGGSSAGGSVGGGGGTTPSVNEEKDACGNGSCEEENNSAQELIIDRTKFNSDYSDEMNEAYQYAFSRSITTMEDIEKADMEGNLTRIAMAKMLSQYAINVLGKKPANTIVPKFSDITEELNAEYDYGVSLAYQLGIMGINMPGNKFRPFDKVTRAEFVTALSRLLYNIEDGEILYYSTHMELLNKLGIIAVTDPDMEELRGYVMLMLMRSASK